MGLAPTRVSLRRCIGVGPAWPPAPGQVEPFLSLGPEHDTNGLALALEDQHLLDIPPS